MKETSRNELQRVKNESSCEELEDALRTRKLRKSLWSVRKTRDRIEAEATRKK